jgi:hypothetical protein
MGLQLLELDDEVLITTIQLDEVPQVMYGDVV